MELATALREIRRAATDDRRVVGLTHQHYKYPARFSPAFVAATIEAFSAPGDLVLDPYMGGGTTIVEALAAGRRAVGCDLNSLAVFVSEAKTIVVTDDEAEALRAWASVTVPTLNYRDVIEDKERIICPERTRNLHLPRARPIKKYLALALASCEKLPTRSAQMFARCALLNVSQWALNGRKTSPTLSEFRRRLTEKTFEMLRTSAEFAAKICSASVTRQTPELIHASSQLLPEKRPFNKGTLADLVVTSPPYPGVHILYHRWQVDGRRETPAPYWIANCLDGQGAAYYNFGDRKQSTLSDYFQTSLLSLRSIRRVIRCGGVIVQMLAFSNPRRQLPRYLENMTIAGFRELQLTSQQHRRIWRRVPGRSWHAEMKGDTNSAREVVLLHEAV